MEAYLGSILLFAGSQPPSGWMFCQGQQLQLRNYQALFAILGTRYGGDGSTTFNLPDLRGAVPIQQGQYQTTAYALGQKGGNQTVILTSAQMPTHTHAITGGTTTPINGTFTATMSVNNTAGSGTIGTPNNNYLATDGNGSGIYAANSDGTSKLNAGAITVNATGVTFDSSKLQNATTGGSQPFSIMQPYVALNFIICINGIFPSPE